MYVYILPSQMMPLAPPVQAVASYIEDLVGKLLPIYHSVYLQNTFISH